jgi:FecR protein
MSERCQRSAQVEALFDQRLDQPTTHEVEQHVAQCDSCRELLAGLGLLRKALREPAGAPNAFAMKRLRRETLDRAQGAPPSPAGRRSIVRVTAALVALATIVSAIAGILFWVLSPPAAEVTVMAAPGASFSREEVGSTEIVRLTDGAFEFDVHSHERRLLVMVPDGEIEDIGTRFRVVVQNGATSEISVSEGQVEYRKEGAAPLRLIAGMTYRPVPAEGERQTAADAVLAPQGVAASANTSPVAAVPATASANEAKQRGVIARPALSGAPNTSTAARSASAEPPAASQKAPPGLTAEDVAYMRVVHLMRAGHTAKARAAAQQYLADFPAGLRRGEMQSVIKADD